MEKVSLKVYEAERVAIVGEGDNSGRYSLLQLLLLNEQQDEAQYDLELKRPLIEFLGEDTQLVDKKILRKQIIYLSQSPTLFYGTVKENIDPYNEFSEKEIIRTLHFLKVT